MGSTIAITGAGGVIGRRLVAALAAADGVDRVVALDVEAPAGLDAGDVDLVVRRVDVRDRAELAAAFAGADVVVHLAAQLDPLRDEARMRSINVEGTRNVVEVAHAQGVRHLVHVSSASVYGAHADNPLPLDEDRPLRPNRPFSYAEQKAEADAWVTDWAAAHPDTAVTVLRPAIVAGHGIENFVTRQLDALRLTVVGGHRPPLQFVHVDDVASAIVHVVTHRIAGVHNVSAEGWLSFDEVVAITGRRLLTVPEEVAFTLADRLWRAGLAEAPSGQVPYLMHPWVVSVDRLTATGWSPRHSNRDALAALFEEHADRLVLGPVTTTRGRARGVAAGLGAVGVVAGALAVRRARRRRR